MKLTDKMIQAALRRKQRKKLSDGAGMYLLIDPPRQPGWRLKYRFAGREKLLSLGVYPDTSLQLARRKREDARRLLAGGINPSEERKEAQKTDAATFRAVADDWIKRGCPGSAKKAGPETIALLESRLKSTLLPAFGSKPITEIEPKDLLGVLRRIEDKGNHETAHRVRALYGRVARFAVATGRAERDASADLRGALTPVATEHFAAITEPARIGELLRAIDSYQGQPAVEYALKLAPLVFVRPGELRGAAWREFALDGKEPEWRVPAERMKMNAEHVVPLSTQTVTVLRELHALTGDGELLFPGLRSASRPISNNTLNAGLRRMGFSQDEMTAHGFRSMASTRLNEMGFDPDVIELQLAHQERNKVRAAYNRAQKIEDRRKMMQAWADYLDGLKAGGSNVVAIRRPAATAA